MSHTQWNLWRKFGLAGSMNILDDDKGSLSDMQDMKDLKYQPNYLLWEEYPSY